MIIHSSTRHTGGSVKMVEVRTMHRFGDIAGFCACDATPIPA